MIITRAPGHPQGSEFNQNHPNMSPEAPAHPKGVNNELNSQVLNTFGGVRKVQNPINRAAYSSKKERYLFFQKEAQRPLGSLNYSFNRMAARVSQCRTCGSWFQIMSTSGSVSGTV